MNIKRIEEIGEYGAQGSEEVKELDAWIGAAETHQLVEAMKAAQRGYTRWTNRARMQARVCPLVERINRLRSDAAA